MINLKDLNITSGTTDFNELVFNEHPNPNHFGGVQSFVKFKNGYVASIVKTPHSYGGSEGLYEIAVFGKDGEISYTTPITNGVIGYLDENQVSDVLKQINNLND